MMRTSLVIALLAAVGPAPARADETWYQAYDSALKAVEARQWTVAEAKLRTAIRDGPRPGRNVRAYGLRFIDYLPGYYLGIACFHQQKYREALEELQRVEASSLVSKRDPEFQQMSDLIEKASEKLAAKPGPAPSSASETVARASESQREAETLARYARDLLDQGQLEEARRALETARAKDAANPSLPGLADALARKEAERRTKAEQEAKLAEQQKGAEQQKRAELEKLLESGRQLLAAKRYREARDLFARAQASGAGDPRLGELAASVDLAEGLGELSALVAKGSWAAARQKALDLASRNRRDPELLRFQALIDKHLAEAGPAELERAGLRAFYSGKYETAAAIFDQLAAGPGRSARTLFRLACSNAALGFSKGQDGQDLLAKAREQFAAARRLDPRLAYDQTLISPRIRRLWEEAR